MIVCYLLVGIALKCVIVQYIQQSMDLVRNTSTQTPHSSY